MAQANLHVPQLACIVLSLAAQPGLVEAVRSLLNQGEAIELVVVNSGGGDPRAMLQRAGLHVPVVHRKERMYAGGVRNLGIQATRAPFVAFLAADCTAEPGWVRGRIARHVSGALAVSSAVTNPNPRNPFAQASYLSLFARRMPTTPTDQWLHYGVSYARQLFERYGLFAEDLRAGEDTEFNQRFSGEIPIMAAPEVRSLHAFPTTPLALLQDQAARGERAARSYFQISGHGRRRELASNRLRGVAPAVRAGLREASGPSPSRWRMGLVAPWLLAGSIAYGAGALLFRPSRHSARLAQPTASVARSSSSEPRILALLVVRNELANLPNYFANVAPHVDGVVALDDGSTDGTGEFLAAQPSVLEVVRLPASDPHVWDEPRNRRLIVEAAYRHQPDWLVVVDADERLERNFRLRALAVIAEAEAAGQGVIRPAIRELWDFPDTYRVDGIWSQKHFARLFRARSDHEFDPSRFHGHWAPLNSLGPGRELQADLNIYHLKMIQRQDRLTRRLRYEQLDPDAQWQSIGYAYLTDEIGLRVEQIPPGREYTPFGPA